MLPNDFVRLETEAASIFVGGNTGECFPRKILPRIHLVHATAACTPHKHIQNTNRKDGAIAVVLDQSVASSASNADRT